MGVSAASFSRHFHQAKGRHAHDIGGNAVFCQLFPQKLGQFVNIFLLAHVQKVDDDDAGQIAQAQLICDFRGGLDVYFQLGRVRRLAA